MEPNVKAGYVNEQALTFLSDFFGGFTLIVFGFAMVQRSINRFARSGDMGSAEHS